MKKTMLPRDAFFPIFISEMVDFHYRLHNFMNPKAASTARKTRRLSMTGKADARTNKVTERDVPAMILSSAQHSSRSLRLCGENKKYP